MPRIIESSCHHREELERRHKRKQLLIKQNKQLPQTIEDIKKRWDQSKSIISEKHPRNTKIKWLTCKGRSDGIGSQSMGVISLMVTAKALGLGYVYKPFVYIQHCPVKNPTPRELKTWVDGFERQLNFEKTSCIPNINTLNKLIKTVDHRDIVNTIKNGHLKGAHILASKESHLFNEYFRNDQNIIQAWQNIIPQLQEHYGWDRSSLPHFDLKDECWKHVAVHVRRGDAVGNTRRTLDIGYYKNVMQSIITCSQSNVKIAFHIYSQGDVNDFKDFNSLEHQHLFKIIFHINVNVNETLHHLANSDVLIMAKSSLSYLCALLNTKGCIIYYPFWLSIPKHLEDKWVVWNENEKLLSQKVFE